MKKIFAMMLLFVLLASCARTGTTESTTEETTEAGAIALTTRTSATTEIRTYPTETTTTKRAIDPNKVIEDSVLGIKVGDTNPETLLARLKKLGFLLHKDADGNERFVPEWDWCSFYYESDSIRFEYNDDTQLYGIVIKDVSIATKSGIRVGDSLEKVRKIYGEPDRKTANDDALYYTNGKTYLQFINDWKTPNGVISWSIWAKEPLYFEDAY